MLKDPRLTGLFTAVITPFTDDGESIDHARLEAQIAFQAQGGVAGIVLCGTTGESPTLSASEYHEFVTHGIRCCHDHHLLAIVGTGSNSTAHAVELQRLAASLGADAGLSVNPYYNKPTQEGLYRHFLAVADAADLNVILYNIPGRCGVGLEPGTIERLCAHDRIVAVKDASGSIAGASVIARRCPQLALLSGDDAMTLPFGSIGGVGVVSVTSNVCPSQMAALCKAMLAGRWDDARRVHETLAPLWKALTLETNPIPIKAAMAMCGRDTGAMRLPMTPATDGTKDALRTVLTDMELL